MFPYRFSASRARLRIVFGIGLVFLILMFFLSFGCGDDDDDDDDASGGDDDDSAGPDITMESRIPKQCKTCHGAPPDTCRHPNNYRCSRCHGYVIDADLNWVQENLHNNGEVNYAVGCSSCHGWDQGVSPPESLTGQADEYKKGTGAHKAMRRDAIQAHRVNCINCHVVPTATWEEGHIDGDQTAEVVFGNLATHNGANPTWDGQTCSNTYCHGATLEGGTLKNPSWYDDTGAPGMCGACHRMTDPQGNADADCHSCHPTSVDAAQQLLERGTHINGTIDMGEDD